MIIKKHNSNGKLVLAICDSDIFGKCFEEGKKVLDLSSDFYRGDETDEKDILGLVKKSYMINAAGKEAVEFLKKHEFVEEVKEIDGVPYAQVLIEN